MQRLDTTLKFLVASLQLTIILLYYSTSATSFNPFNIKKQCKINCHKKSSSSLSWFTVWCLGDSCCCVGLAQRFIIATQPQENRKAKHREGITPSVGALCSLRVRASLAVSGASDCCRARRMQMFKQKVGNDCGATLRTLHKQIAAGAPACVSKSRRGTYLRFGHKLIQSFSHLVNWFLSRISRRSDFCVMSAFKI